MVPREAGKDGGDIIDALFFRPGDVTLERSVSIVVDFAVGTVRAHGPRGQYGQSAIDIQPLRKSLGFLRALAPPTGNTSHDRGLVLWRSIGRKPAKKLKPLGRGAGAVDKTNAPEPKQGFSPMP